MGLTSALFYVLIAVIALAVGYLRKRNNYWKDRGIPHDKPSLIRGNFQGLLKEYSYRDIYLRYYNKYKGTGPFCGFYWFQKPAAFVTDLNLMKHVLIKDFNNFGNRNLYYNTKDDPLSGHLFALKYTKWKPIRHKLSPTFTSGKMKFMFPTLVKLGYEFVDVLGEMLKESSTVEVKELFARYTTDVIGSCAFGIDSNSLKDPNAEFRVLGRYTFKKMKEANWSVGFGTSFPKLARMLGVRVFPADINSFFMKIVRDTMEYREKHHITHNDFMDKLIEMKNDAESGKGDMRLSFEEVAAQAFAFYLGGFETSSTTGSFALYELALNQDVQDKLRNEINEVLDKYNQEFTYNCMKDMQYMQQVISETLRLYTVIPHVERCCFSDYQVPGAPGYVIEKGTMVLIPATAIHRDPEYYPNPHVFNPDHFLPERVEARDSFTWLPFGDGPRNCIGMRFAQMQTFVGLAVLLQRFKFSRAEETEVPIKIDTKKPFCGSKGGIYLKVEKV